MKVGEYMSDQEMLKVSVEEFSRLQDYMVECEKDSIVYKKMKRRYIELKVILAASGINLTELDMINERSVCYSDKRKEWKVWILLHYQLLCRCNNCI